MHPYWFHIGAFPVRAYSTLFVLAFLFGLIVALYIFRAEGLRKYEDDLLDISPWLLVCGILGARVWQVFFFDWPYYRANPAEIPAIWHGGLSIQGGLVGAVAVGLYFVWKRRLPLWAILDAVAPGMIIGQSIGRDANLMNGDAFGSPNPAGYGLLYPPDSLAQQTYPNQTLWPAEVWEGQADVLIFCILLLMLLYRRRRIKGTVFLTYIILYDAVRFGLEMLRGDSPRFLGWTAAQWTAVVVIVVCLLLWLWLWLRGQEENDAEGGEPPEPRPAAIPPEVPPDEVDTPTADLTPPEVPPDDQTP